MGQKPVTEDPSDRVQGDAAAPVNFTKYDRRSLTYANSFDSPLTATVIRTLEWFTGKLSIIRMIRAFEKRGAPTGQPFWRAALGTMGIDLLTPQEEIDAKLFLQLPHTRGHVGLDAVQLFGSPGDAAFAGDGAEYMQIGEFHFISLLEIEDIPIIHFF